MSAESKPSFFLKGLDNGQKNLDIQMNRMKIWGNSQENNDLFCLKFILEMLLTQFNQSLEQIL